MINFRTPIGFAKLYEKTLHKKKITTIYNNGTVTIHSLTSKCISAPRRRVTRGVAMSLKDNIIPCTKCWTTRKWNGMLKGRQRKELTVDDILKEMEMIE